MMSSLLLWLLMWQWPATIAWFSLPFSQGRGSFYAYTQLCGTTTRPDGVCLNYPLCVAEGGSPDASVASCAAFGYCCRFTLRCGSTLTAPVGFWRSPRYPDPAHDTGFCGVTISPLPDAAFLRVEFLDTQLTAPEPDTCDANTLTIYGQKQGQSSTICGALTNYNTLVEVGHETRDGRQQPRDIHLLLSVRDPRYKYNIKLTQIRRSQVKLTDSGLPDVGSLQKQSNFAPGNGLPFLSRGPDPAFSDAHARSPLKSVEEAQPHVSLFQDVPTTVMDEMGNKLYSQPLKMDYSGDNEKDQDTEKIGFDQRISQQSKLSDTDSKEQDTEKTGFDQSVSQKSNFSYVGTLSPPVIEKSNSASQDENFQGFARRKSQVKTVPTSVEENNLNLTPSSETLVSNNAQVIRDSTGNQLYFSNKYSLFSPTTRHTGPSALSFDSTTESVENDKMIHRTDSAPSVFHLIYYPDPTSGEQTHLPEIKSSKLETDAVEGSTVDTINITIDNSTEVNLLKNIAPFQNAKNFSAVSQIEEPNSVSTIQSASQNLKMSSVGITPEKLDPPNNLYSLQGEHLAPNTRDSINALAKKSVEQMLKKLQMKVSENSNDKESETSAHKIENNVNLDNLGDSSSTNLHFEKNNSKQTPAVFVKKIGNRLYFFKSNATEKQNSTGNLTTETPLSSKTSEFEMKKRKVYSQLAARILEEVKRYAKNPLQQTTTEVSPTADLPSGGLAADSKDSETERKGAIVKKLMSLFQQNRESRSQKHPHSSVTDMSSSGKAFNSTMENNILKTYLQHLKKEFVKSLMNSRPAHVGTSPTEELQGVPNNTQETSEIIMTESGNILDGPTTSSTSQGLSMLNEPLHNSIQAENKSAENLESTENHEPIRSVADLSLYQLLQALIRSNLYYYENSPLVNSLTQSKEVLHSAETDSPLPDTSIVKTQDSGSPKLSVSGEVAREHHDMSGIQKISERLMTIWPQNLIPQYSTSSKNELVSTNENVPHSTKITPPHINSPNNQVEKFKQPEPEKKQETSVFNHGETERVKFTSQRHDEAEKRESFQNLVVESNGNETRPKQPSQRWENETTPTQPEKIRLNENIVDPLIPLHNNGSFFENSETTTAPLMTANTYAHSNLEELTAKAPTTESSHTEFTPVHPDNEIFDPLPRIETEDITKNYFEYSDKAFQLWLLQHSLQQTIKNHVLTSLLQERLQSKTPPSHNSSQVNVRETGEVVDEQNNVLFGSTSYYDQVDEVNENETDYSFLYDALAVYDAGNDENESFDIPEAFPDFPKPILSNTDRPLSSDVLEDVDNDYEYLQYPASQILPDVYDYGGFLENGPFSTTLPTLTVKDDNPSPEEIPIGAEAVHILTQYADLKQDLKSNDMEISQSSVSLKNTSLSDLTPSKSKVILQLVLAGESEVVPSSINKEAFDDPPVSSFLLINFPNNPVVNVTTAEQVDRNITIITGKYNETYFPIKNEPINDPPFAINIAPQFEDSANIFKVGIVEQPVNHLNVVSEQGEISQDSGSTSVSAVTVRSNDASTQPDSGPTMEEMQTLDVVSGSGLTDAIDPDVDPQILTTATPVDTVTILPEIQSNNESSMNTQDNVMAPADTDNSNVAESSGDSGGIPGISLSGSLSVELSTGTLSTNLRFRTFNRKKAGYSHTGYAESGETSSNSSSVNDSPIFGINTTRENFPKNREDYNDETPVQHEIGGRINEDIANFREDLISYSSTPKEIKKDSSPTLKNDANKSVLMSPSKVLEGTKPPEYNATNGGFTKTALDDETVGGSFDLLKYLATIANISVSSASNTSAFRNFNATSGSALYKIWPSNIQESREFTPTVSRTMTLEQAPKLNHFAPYYGTVMTRNDVGDHNLCSAALISSRHSLTAASCVLRRGYAERGYSVRVYYDSGTFSAAPSSYENLWDRPSHVDLVSVTFHPMYDHHNFHYDIAVLTHAHPVLGTLPVALPSVVKSYEGTTAAIMGHGMLRSVPPHNTSQMKATSIEAQARFLPVSVLSNIYCQQRHSGTDSSSRPPAASTTIRDEMLCVEAYAPFLHTCEVDRGGPVVSGFPQAPVLIGIVSGNVGGCASSRSPSIEASSRYPDVAVRITEVMDFISVATAELEFEVAQQTPSSLRTLLGALG